MTLKDKAKDLMKEAARDISRNVIGHTIRRVSDAIVSKVPNKKTVVTKKFRLMLSNLSEQDEEYVAYHVSSAAKLLLARNPPEYLCYDFLASLEDMNDEDVNPLIKSAFNVKARFPRPPVPKK